MRARVLVVILLAACGGGHLPSPDAPGPVQPTPNPSRDVVDTQLAFDVTALTATATITFAPSTTPGASLETGDLQIASVQLAGADLPFAASAGKLDLGLPASEQPLAVTIAYQYSHHEGFTGASKTGYTFLWPY